MKKSFLSLAAALAFLSATAQTPPAQTVPFPRTISVTGTAEQELVPDEIYVHVELKEYVKPGMPKVPLETIRRQFLATVRATGLPDSLVSIAAYDGSNGPEWWQRRKRKEVLLSSITYQLKLHSSRQVSELVDRLDENATHNFQVARVSHSRITEIRRGLKIAAVRAAREKAQYMAEAAGEGIGPTVTISESSDHHDGPIWTRSNTMMSNTTLEGGGGGPQEATDFRKIRLKFEVAVVFALK